jgi:hypothetical protein
MTDLPVPPQPAARFPPPPGPPAVPPGAPAGRPRVWQAALIFLALGSLAGGSCALFLQHPSGGSSDLYTLLFLLSIGPAAGAFALLVFRLWRRRHAEAWPSVAQAVLMAVAGGVLAAGGCGGWAFTMDTSALLPIAIGLFVVFVLGAAIAVGAGELFVISVFRLILKRPGAR